MKATLNSNLLPIISVGMYNTTLAPDYVLSTDTIDDDIKEGYIDYTEDEFWERFDNAGYIKAIAKLAGHYINGDYAKDGIKVTIKTGNIYSPNEYNFATDEIDLEVEFEKAAFSKYARENKLVFGEWLAETYKSYSGFISLMPQSYEEWLLEWWDNENSKAIAAILTYWFEVNKDDILEDKTDFPYYVHDKGELYYSEFYKEPAKA